MHPISSRSRQIINRLHAKIMPVHFQLARSGPRHWRGIREPRWPRTVEDGFECPRCSKRIQVPQQGKSIELKEQQKIPIIEAAPRNGPSDASAKSVHKQAMPAEDERDMMARWGDYMAEAGLTKTPRENDSREHGRSGKRLSLRESRRQTPDVGLQNEDDSKCTHGASRHGIARASGHGG